MKSIASIVFCRKRREERYVERDDGKNDEQQDGIRAKKMYQL